MGVCSFLLEIEIPVLIGVRVQRRGRGTVKTHSRGVHNVGIRLHEQIQYIIIQGKGMQISNVFNLIAVFMAVSVSQGCHAPGSEKKIPVIYCSDLFHPHDDPDDHFDLACLYALEELELKGVVLDQGERQKSSPGAVAVKQMNRITGRDVPYATGLSEKLSSMGSRGKGVDLILKILRQSTDPVTIITVGSLRDVAAAYLQEKELFKKKVERLLVFIGEASADTVEWNVGLDPLAFKTIMNSGLPIWWAPCFDGGNFKNKGNATFWKASHRDILKYASNRVMNFFIYALLKKQAPDPLGFLDRTIDEPEKEQALTPIRNLWCATVFVAITERKIVKRGEEYLALPQDQIKGEEEVIPYRFVPVSMTVNKDARVVYEDSSKSNPILRFQKSEIKNYAEIMTSVAANLIGSLDS